MSAIVHHGDCRDVMAAMPEHSFAAIATDPPYGLGFMGKGWDRGVPGPEFWSAALRVTQPGGRLVACGGPRTWHRLACAIEDAGWEITDSLAWLFGQGWPKARSQLKPAHEPIILARAPGPIAELGIDACRVSMSQADRDFILKTARPNTAGAKYSGAAVGNAPSTPTVNVHDGGRYPANVVLGCACEVEHEPDCAVALLDAASGPETGAHGRSDRTYDNGGNVYNAFKPGGRRSPVAVDADGGASRFFYVAKATRAERERWLRESESGRTNRHPTVKPVALMRWLLRLVAAPGARVLDPFCGSGTTCVAGVLEGYDADGIDQDAESCEVARARVLGAHEEAGTLTPTAEPAALAHDGPTQLGLLGGTP